MAMSGDANPETRLQVDASGQLGRNAHWRMTVCLTVALLMLWFFVTFVLIYFARELRFKILGWPFSFWLAGQGALVIYCLIIWFYARRMSQIDNHQTPCEKRD